MVCPKKNNICPLVTMDSLGFIWVEKIQCEPEIKIAVPGVSGTDLTPEPWASSW